MNRLELELPGLDCFDAFAPDIVDSIITGASNIVICPAGLSVSRGVDALEAELGGRWIALEPDPSRPASVGIQEAIDEVYRLPRKRFDQVEDWAVERATEIQEQLWVLQIPTQLEAELARGWVDTLERITHCLRDADRRLTFVILTAANLAWPELLEDAITWEPMRALERSLPYDEPSRISTAGWRTYVSSRAYWEVGGRFDWLEELQEVHQNLLSAAQTDNSDDLIDAEFERCLNGVTLDGERIEEVFRALVPVAALHRGEAMGRIPRGSAVVEEATALGLVWRPPGLADYFLVPTTVRALLEREDFIWDYRLEGERATNFVRAARVSPLLASWIQTLCAYVERALLQTCKSMRPRQLLLRTKPHLQARLEDYRDRQSRDFMYYPTTELLDQAGFGELIQLLPSPALDQLGVERGQLWGVRNARNLAAHLHPVNWQGVRVVLAAVAQLVEHGS